MDHQLELWKPREESKMITEALEPSVFVPFAHSLSQRQQIQVIEAIKSGSYDMATEFVWKKAMTRLRAILSNLGMSFIGEMLQKPDFDDSSNIEREINDFTTIQLAEQLNIISKTAALKLRHGLEIINHYFSDTAASEDEYLPPEDCISIIKSCVNYLLNERDISISIASKFAEFRGKLTSHPLDPDDHEINAIAASSIFFIRTSLVVLLNGIKEEKGIKKENSLSNLISLLPHVWSKLKEEDRYMIGNAYRDVVSSGNENSANGLKIALMKVRGFDYVPETLRSSTFVIAAKELINAHYDFGNFYAEPGLVEKLANLGTSIPKPAFSYCAKAYLYVYLGNKYGVANNAQKRTQEQLKKISKERWEYFFQKIFLDDTPLLDKLTYSEIIARFINAFKTGLLPIDALTGQRELAILQEAIEKEDVFKIKNYCVHLFNTSNKK